MCSTNGRSRLELSVRRGQPLWTFPPPPPPSSSFRPFYLRTPASQGSRAYEVCTRSVLPHALFVMALSRPPPRVRGGGVGEAERGATSRSPPPLSAEWQSCRHPSLHGPCEGSGLASARVMEMMSVCMCAAPLFSTDTLLCVSSHFWFRFLFRSHSTLRIESTRGTKMERESDVR